MAKLRSGRNVGITLDPYMKKLKKPSIEYIYATPGYFRLSIKNPTDLLEFASIIQLDDQDEKKSAPTGFLVRDLMNGKIPWSSEDLQDLKEWLSSNKNLQPWLEDKLFKAKLIVDPIFFRHHPGVGKTQTNRETSEKTQSDKKDASKYRGERIKNVNFGIVSDYISDKGFGFVRGLLIRDSSEVFFHIKTIQKSNSQLARKITADPLSEDFYIWFETEVTPIGKKVRAILSSEQVQRGAIADPSELVMKIEALWLDTKQQKAPWLDDVTFDILGQDRANELSLERKNREDAARRSRELVPSEITRRLIIEKENKQLQLEKNKSKNEIEENEFQELLAEMGKFNFKYSSQLSNHIVNHQLGYKYRNISGVLKMELNGTTWDFKGGFPTDVYARLCQELGLLNQNTRAKPIAFESFDSIETRSSKK